MHIKIFLSDRLARLARDRDMFEVNGETVGECLNSLTSLAPAIKQALFYDTGKELQDHIVLLVNKERAEAEGLEKKVRDGDVIHIALLSQH